MGEVEESKQSALWHFARSHVLSFAAVLALGFLLLLSLLVTAGLAAARKFIAPSLPEGNLHLVSMLVSFAGGGVVRDDVQMAARRLCCLG